MKLWYVHTCMGPIALLEYVGIHVFHSPYPVFEFENMSSEFSYSELCKPRHVIKIVHCRLLSSAPSFVNTEMNIRRCHQKI